MRTLLCFAAMLVACGWLFFWAPHHVAPHPVATGRQSALTLASAYDRFFDDLDATPVGFLPPMFLLGAGGLFAAMYPAILVLLMSGRVGRGWLITAALLAAAGAVVNFVAMVMANLKMGSSGSSATVFFWLIPAFPLVAGLIGIVSSYPAPGAAVNGWLPQMTGGSLMISRGIVLAICAVALAIPAKRLLMKPPSDAERLARFEETIQSKGSVFRMSLEGKEVAFLVMDCKVYLLTVANKEVTKEKVLETDFYPWFTVCTRSTLAQDAEYVKVSLAKQAVGAGGGSVGGGDYRSRDGRSWEKRVEAGWRPVGEIQR